MAINLQKGQRISLEKEAPGLSRVIMGLGWDVAQKRSGFLGFGGGHDFDLDASCLMLQEDGKIQATNDLIYYHNLQSADGSVIHSGDNLTGEGAGDDEQIRVYLSSVSPQFAKLVFVVNIYEAKKRNQDFGQVQNAFVRMVDEASGREIARFNLTDDYSGMYTLIMAEVYRHNNEWKMVAIGEGTHDDGLTELLRKYR